MPLCFLGLDWASIEIIIRIMGRVRLENFERLLGEGKAAPLASDYPYVTAPAWTSIFSGVNPGKHGIFDLLNFGPEGVTAPNMRSCEVPFLWDYLTWANRSVLALGIPAIHPAPPVNGVFVTG